MFCISECVALTQYSSSSSAVGKFHGQLGVVSGFFPVGSIHIWSPRLLSSAIITYNFGDDCVLMVATNSFTPLPVPFSLLQSYAQLTCVPSTIPVQPCLPLHRQDSPDSGINGKKIILTQFSLSPPPLLRLQTSTICPLFVW